MNLIDVLDENTILTELETNNRRNFRNTRSFI